MYIVSDTLDNYLGYHYYVCAITDRSQHKLGYVAVDKNDNRVAWIEIETKIVHFYSHTPSDVITDLKTLETWIGKNQRLSKKRWNKLNPKYHVGELK